MTKATPDWAVEKAVKLLGVSPSAQTFYRLSADTDVVVRAFARYIAEHEQPPVDPVFEAARSICAKVVRDTSLESWAEGYIAGRYDDEPEVQHAVKTIRKLIDSSK